MAGDSKLSVVEPESCGELNHKRQDITSSVFAQHSSFFCFVFFLDPTNCSDILTSTRLISFDYEIRTHIFFIELITKPAHLKTFNVRFF